MPGAGSGAEDLSAALGAGCGAWFQDADRTFYRASGLLQRAEAASGAERAALAREALRLMMQARRGGGRPAGRLSALMEALM